MKTIKIQYIRTKLQIETAQQLLKNAIREKRNEKAKILFQKDLNKVNKIVGKIKPLLIKAAKLIEKQENKIDKEVRKITKGKIKLYDKQIDETMMDKLAQLAVINGTYYANRIRENKETDITPYEEMIDLKKEQKEIDTFILEMILGKVTATELTTLINKIKK